MRFKAQPTNLGLRDVLESVRHGESSLEGGTTAQLPASREAAQPRALGNQPGQRQEPSHGENCLQQQSTLYGVLRKVRQPHNISQTMMAISD